jgi:L-2-aminoadipate reductase
MGIPKLPQQSRFWIQPIFRTGEISTLKWPSLVIAKATQEAGEISETVRAFISANLKLWIEVLGLALCGDGSLIGGDVAGRDMLASVEHLRASSRGVAVGPDSTPALSFTSGS